jgi:tRNA A-37 threonylcarbamoyl transferase component Bud32
MPQLPPSDGPTPKPRTPTRPGLRALDERGGDVADAPKITVAPVSSPSGEAGVDQRCPRCGTVSPGEHNFCSSCGFNLATPKDGERYRDPLIGAVVGERYRLLSRIGMGGMGSVYKAEHVRMGKIVAVKLLHGDLSRDESMIRRFTREARAASKLSSAHTVSVFDYGQSDGLVYLVMEYLQGLDLGHLLRKSGPLGLSETSRILHQVADSLTEAHAKGIVHRDLKPENIFMCATEGEGEVVKVLDFGLAKLREARDESFVDTARGNLVGTPYYMSPEQISGDDVDVRSDIYGLAAVSYKLLTGKPPYPHENPVVVLGKHLSAPVPRISEVAPELVAVEAVLSRALAKKPSERYGTVQEFADAVAEAAGDPGAASELTRLGVSTRELADVSTKADFDRFERNLRLRRMALSVLAVLFAAAAGFVFWWGVIERGFQRSASESEPNDDIAESDRVFAGAPIEGFIGEPAIGQRADVDFYMVENRTGQNVVASIEVSGVPGIDLVIKTYSRDGRALTTVDSGKEGRRELLPNQYLSSPFLYVMVREYWVENRPPRWNTEIPYHLRVRLREHAPGEEIEPNDELTDGLQMRQGEAVSGYVGWRGDVDSFRTPDLPPGGTMADVLLEGVPGLDLALALHDIRGEELRRFDRAGAGEDEHARFFAAAENGHGVLYLRVVAADGVSALPTATYRLHVNYEPVAPLRVPLGSQTTP